MVFYFISAGFYLAKAYCNTKLIGTENATLTGVPRCFLGFILGGFKDDS